MLFSNPNILANKKLPANPNGTDNMTTIGMNMLSYKAQSIKYMNTIQITNIIAVELLDDASSLDIPPNSYP